MTRYHWSALCTMIWNIGAYLMRNESAEVMLKWHRTTEVAKDIPWKD